LICFGRLQVLFGVFYGFVIAHVGIQSKRLRSGGVGSGFHFSFCLFEQAFIFEFDGFFQGVFTGCFHAVVYLFLAGNGCNIAAILDQPVKHPAIGFHGAFEYKPEVKFGGQVFLPIEVFVGNFQGWFSGGIEGSNVIVEHFGVTASFVVFFLIVEGFVVFPQRFFPCFEDLFHTFGADIFQNNFPFFVNKQQGWIRTDGVFTGEFGVFSFFHVNFQAQEVGVEKFANFLIGEGFFGHAFARAAPRGKGVNKNNFFFAFGFFKGLCPGAMEELNALGAERCDGKEEAKKQEMFHGLNGYSKRLNLMRVQK